jgi:hypothetical protein
LNTYYVMGTDPETGRVMLMTRRSFASVEAASGYAASCASVYRTFVVVAVRP